MLRPGPLKTREASRGCSVTTRRAWSRRPEARSPRFAVGDEVLYAGSIGRQGTYAHRHLVNENIVGHKPRSVDFADAAALPLTSITAWEALFDRSV
jgi:NADPH:quinone reductase-like Zn-dependent oxidoreductase